MVDKNNSRTTPAEYIFDIAKPSGPVEFCGFIDGLTRSENSLAGLFKWTCRACGTPNHDAAVIQPNQSFLAEWSCNHCDDTTLVRFHARPTTDWVAQHALAITGKALCHLAEKESPYVMPAHLRKQFSKPGQKMFAWTTIPLLAVIIVMGSMDIRRIQISSAHPQDGPGRTSGISYSWLGGLWVSENHDDMLTFGYMNPTAGRGAYTRAARDGRPSQIVRLEIVHEETTDGRLVLRELRDAPDSATPQDKGSNPILYVTRQSDSMIRMTTDPGKPLMTAYYRAGQPSGP